MRPGDRLVDFLLDFMRCDDRGAAFATWRRVPNLAGGEWLGFRLCYVVEANLDVAVRQLGGEPSPILLRALQRRADALLPPFTETLYLDSWLKSVADADLRALLDRPYVEVGDGGSDYNLGSRVPDLLTVISLAGLQELCEAVRTQSETLLRKTEAFARGASAARANSILGVSIARLERRREALVREGRVPPEVDHVSIAPVGARSTPEESIGLDIAADRALMRAVDESVVRLDAIGVYVLSASLPPSERRTSSKV